MNGDPNNQAEFRTTIVGMSPNTPNRFATVLQRRDELKEYLFMLNRRQHNELVKTKSRGGSILRSVAPKDKILKERYKRRINTMNKKRCPHLK